MAAGPAFSTVATYTVPSATASYTFSSIPSTYTDLILVCDNLVENVNQQGYIRFNSDSGANYSRTAMYGTGSVGASFRQTGQTGIGVGMSGNTGGQVITMDIMGYASTSRYKYLLDREGNASGSVVKQIGLWASTSAISSITIASFDGSSSIQSGAKFTLYGITAA